jgi:hypothetical protein
VIPANGDHFAAYTENGKHRERQVIAWNDTGDAMVVGKAGLVPAQTLPSFEGLFERGDARILTALPGGGWMVDTIWEDGECTTEPVLLWQVHADGTAIPIDTDSHGETGTALGHGSRSYLYHPDHVNPEARKQAGFPAAPSEREGLTG